MNKNHIFGISLMVFWSLLYVVLWIFGVSPTALSDNTRIVLRSVHAYGIFLGTINYFFGYLVGKIKKFREIASWSFILAGAFTGILKAANVFANYNFLAKYAFVGDIFFAIGLAIFVYNFK